MATGSPAWKRTNFCQWVTEIVADTRCRSDEWITRIWKQADSYEFTMEKKLFNLNSYFVHAASGRSCSSSSLNLKPIPSFLWMPHVAFHCCISNYKPADQEEPHFAGHNPDADVRHQLILLFMPWISSFARHGSEFDKRRTASLRRNWTLVKIENESKSFTSAAWLLTECRMLLTSIHEYY